MEVHKRTATATINRDSSRSALSEQIYATRAERKMAKHSPNSRSSDNYTAHKPNGRDDQYVTANENLPGTPQKYATAACMERPPLDVSLNKPFKNHIREEWTTWMANGQHTTAGGYMRAPSFAELCHFVINAWNKIGAETGTESDELWDSGESEGVGSESGSVSAIEELVEEEELSTEADPSTRDRARPGGLHDGFPFYWLYTLMAKWQLHERWCLIPSGERVLSIRRRAVPSQRL
uniref:SCP domain-containing protein n=1 Tax=Trichuris muris TaxID=70415 RepID=A0A5S6Q8C5_TRIMR